MSKTSAPSVPAALLSPGKPRRLWRLIPVVGLFVGILLLFFYRCIFLGEILSPAAMLRDWAPWAPSVHGGTFNGLRSDDVFLAYPLYASHYEALRQGHIPFWDPWKLGGTLGGMAWVSIGQILYPPAWVYLLGQPGPMTVFYAIARLLVGGLGMFAWMRTLEVSRTGAILSGIAFMLTGSSIVWLSSPVPSVMVFLPWALMALESWLRRPGWLPAAGLSLAVGSQFLAGYVAQSFVFCVTLAFVTLIRLIQIRSGLSTGSWLARLGGLIGAGLAGIAVGSFGILPSLASLSGSAMSARNTASDWLPPTVALQYLDPDILGNPVRGTWWYGSNYCELVSYIGMLPLFLAVLGLGGLLKDRRVLPLALPFGIFAGFVYGIPGIHALAHLPGFSQAAPARWTAPMALLMVALAGLGWDRIQQTPRLLLRTWLAWMATTATILGLGIHHVWPDLVRTGTTRQILESLGFPLGVFLLATPAILMAARHGAVRRGHAIALGTVLVLDLGYFGAGFNPTAETSTFYVRTPGITHLMADRDAGRLLAYESVFMGDTGSLYGLQGLTGYDIRGDRAWQAFLYQAGNRSLSPAQAVTANAFLQATTGTGSAAVNSLVLNVSPESPLLDLASVRHLVMPPDAAHRGLGPFAYQGPDCLVRDNPHARPWAWWTPDARLMPDDEQTYDRLRSSPRGGPDEALLATVPAPGTSLDNDGTGSVRILDRDPGTMRLETSGTSSGFVMLSDRHDPGWRVTIDDRAAEVLRADAVFMAIAVPAGKHRIALDFRPPLVVTSFWTSLLGLMWVGGVVLVLGSRRLLARGRSRPPEPPPLRPEGA